MIEPDSLFGIRSEKLEFVCLDELVPLSHPYRKFYEVIDFPAAMQPLQDLSTEGKLGPNGFGC